MIHTKQATLSVGTGTGRFPAPMSETTRATAALLDRRLGRAASRFALADALWALVAALAVFGGLWALAAGLEALLWLPTAGRLALLALVAAAVGGLLFVGAGRPLLQRLGLLPGLSPDATARRVGSRVPEAGDRLVALYDLTHGRATDAPSPLLDGAVAHLDQHLDGVDFARAERFEQTRRLLRVAWVPVVALLALFAAAPGPVGDASARLLAPLTAFARPAPFALNVTPGDVTVAAGDSVVLRIAVEGPERPAAVAVEIEGPDGQTDTQKLAPDAHGGYAHTLRDVRRPVRYRLVALPVETDWYRVTVAARPEVAAFTVALTPPAYARQARQTLPPGVGDVAALPGTRAEVAVRLGGADAAEAFLDFDGNRVPLTVSGGVAGGAFTVSREGTYRVVLRTAGGLTNADPVLYRVTVLPDTPPDVAIAAPGADAPVPADRTTALDVRATDDYGVARLALFYRVRLDSLSNPPFRSRGLGAPPRDGLLRSTWRITEAGALTPGATVEYYVQAWDGAGHSARTPVQRLRVASTTEAAEALDAAQDSTGETLRSLQEDAERAKDAFSQVRERLRRAQGDQARSALDALRERQQAVQQQAERAAEQAREALERMREQDTASPDLQAEMRQLQATFEELNDPDLQRALEELQEALRNEQFDVAEQAAERYAQEEEALRERIERARALLERMRVRQGLQEAARQAEERAEQQEAIEQATEALEQAQQPKPGETEAERREREAEAQRQAEELARQQEQAAQQARELQQRLEELQQRMAQTPNTPREAMQQLQQELQEQNPAEQAEQNAEQLREGQTQEAQEGQQQMQQQYRRAQQQLQEMEQGMQQQSQKLDAAAVRRALDNVLRLSTDQEALRLRTQRATPDSPALRDAARRQSELADGLRTVADTLGRVARRMPMMSRAVQEQTGEALRRMQQANRNLSGRQVPQAAAEQREAMTQMNELALRLSDLLQQQQQQQQGGQGGPSLQQMLQQLQQMSGQQQGLNDQVQRMINEQQGERLQEGAEGQARRMAEQQAQLRRQLRQMSRNPESRGRMMDDLDEVARQMEEVRQELQRGRVSRDMQERQRQILTRLLEAQRSLQQRGQDERREARPPGTPEGTPPAGTPPPPSPAEQLRRDLLRALDAPYAPDVETLIRRYFERIGG